MVTLRQMAEATLGRPGGIAASAIYLLLSFSLLTAYIAKVCYDLTAGVCPMQMAMRQCTYFLSEQVRVDIFVRAARHCGSPPMRRLPAYIQASSS